MKRRSAAPPLFAAQQPPDYLMDASAWFSIDKQPNPADVWHVVIGLIEQNRLFSQREVNDEVESLADRIEPYLARLESRSRGDVPYFLLAGAIAAANPSMAKLRSRKSPADPWVIALANLERLKVVCNESLKRRNRKIPGACDRWGVVCVTLEEMFEAERESFGR